MSTYSERVADLSRVADGHGDEFSNDELLRLGIGYGVAGPLSDEQMRREALEALAELDPCTAIAESIPYSDGADGDDEGGVDALIDYKNALEDALRRATDTLREIASGVPKDDEWRSAADFMEATAATLDRGGVERPERYEDD